MSEAVNPEHPENVEEKPQDASGAMNEGEKADRQKKPYSLNDLRVLIVEDYPFMLELLSTILRELGVGKVYAADSGEAGQKIIAMYNADARSADHLDLVITDWLMANGSGKELMTWIRNHKKR